jgi:SAM-dependent methyltransferase
MRDTNEADFIGGIPEFYDRGLGPVLFADYAVQMAEWVAKAAPARVLETAAGTGIVTRALHEKMPKAALTVTDLNEPMLGVARGKVPAESGVTFQAADAQALPFADGSFDAVVCQFGIMFYPDKAKGYAEALRVLKPGGRYFFSVWDTHRYNTFAGLTNALIQRTFPSDPPSFYSVPFSSAAIDPIKEALQEAGFGGISIEVWEIRKAVADLDMFARGLIFGNPVVDQIRARASVTPQQMHAELVELLAREFGGERPVVPLQTIAYSAIKPA